MRTSHHCQRSGVLSKNCEFDLMNPNERRERFLEIEAELSRIRNGFSVEGNPAEIEDRLLGELDQIEKEEGDRYFFERDAGTLLPEPE